MVCAFTGHRPHKLPWGREEQDPRCLAVKEMIARRLDEARGLGCRTFLCGMAEGCDLYFAEAVLAMRRDHPELRLAAMLPCPEQANGWRVQDRLRYLSLLSQCDSREMLEPSYTPGCMQRRNRAMVERAQVLISVYDGSPSGTGSTVRYAGKLGLTVLPVWI